MIAWAGIEVKKIKMRDSLTQHPKPSVEFRGSMKSLDSCSWSLALSKILLDVEITIKARDSYAGRSNFLITKMY